MTPRRKPFEYFPDALSLALHHDSRKELRLTLINLAPISGAGIHQRKCALPTLTIRLHSAHGCVLQIVGELLHRSEVSTERLIERQFVLILRPDERSEATRRCGEFTSLSPTNVECFIERKIRSALAGQIEVLATAGSQRAARQALDERRDPVRRQPNLLESTKELVGQHQEGTSDSDRLADTRRVDQG